jgi:hypothetical protein
VLPLLQIAAKDLIQQKTILFEGVTVWEISEIG